MRYMLQVARLLWFTSLSCCYRYSSGSISTTNSNHQQNTHRVESPFVDVPTNVFAPRGRLYKVEDAVHTITSSSDVDDVSSTSCIVLTCSNGSVVAISTLPQSPYMIIKSQLQQQDNDINKQLSNNNHRISSLSSSITDKSLCLRDYITTNPVSDLEDYTVVLPFGRIQWPKQVPTTTPNVTTTTTNMTQHSRDNHTDDTILVVSKTSTYTQQQQQQQSSSSSSIALSLTAGNAVESQILQHRIHQNIDRIVAEKGTTTSSFIGTTITTILARMMADQNQQRTQILSSNMGRIVAASAILIEFHTGVGTGRKSSTSRSPDDISINENDQISNDVKRPSSSTTGSTIYQIDPSGQYWICQAVVSGRHASQIEQQLMNRLLERYTSESIQHQPKKSNMATTALSRHQVCTLLSQLSIDDALTIATQCLLDGVTKRKGSQRDDHHYQSRLLLRGIVLSATNNNHISVQTFSHHGLLSRLRIDS